MESTTIKNRRMISEVTGELHANDSRRKDRKLLDDITMKLYDMDNELVKPSDTITSAVTDLRRRVSGRNIPYHHVSRGGKQKAGHGGRGLQTFGASGTSAVHVVKRAASEPHYCSLPPSLSSRGKGHMPPTAELAVRTARRCLSRLESELGRNHSDHTELDLPVRSASLRQQRPVKSTMPMYYLDDWDEGSDDYYVPPPPHSVTRGRSLARVNSARPLCTGMVSPVSNGLVTRQTIRHRSLTPSRPLYGASTALHRHLSPEDDFELVSPSYSNLRARYTEAKNKLDQHKTMLDKYLPLYLGPENAVEIEVDYKFGELCARMPRLDPFRPPMNANNTDTYSKPPRGRPLNNFETKKTSQPKMSDTRKRVRDVICKTRNDKHYYS